MSTLIIADLFLVAIVVFGGFIVYAKRTPTYQYLNRKVVDYESIAFASIAWLLGAAMLVMAFLQK